MNSSSSPSCLTNRAVDDPFLDPPTILTKFYTSNIHEYLEPSTPALLLLTKFIYSLINSYIKESYNSYLVVCMSKLR
jgi:hypothetical protein